MQYISIMDPQQTPNQNGDIPQGNNGADSAPMPAPIFSPDTGDNDTSSNRDRNNVAKFFNHRPHADASRLDANMPLSPYRHDDIILNNPNLAQAQRKPRKKILIVILVAITALLLSGILFLLLFLVPNLTAISKEDALAEFNIISEAADDLESSINTMRRGELSLSRMPNDYILDILANYEVILSSFDKIKNYNNLSFGSTEQNEAFVAAVDAIRGRIDLYKPTVEILSKFNDAFIQEIVYMRSLVNPIVEPSLNLDTILSWSISPEADDLLNSDDEAISNVASELLSYIEFKLPILQEYFALNCSSPQQTSACTELRVEFLANSEVLLDKTIPAAIVSSGTHSELQDYGDIGYLSSLIYPVIYELNKEMQYGE